eukprot:gene11369-11518_t
MTGAGQPPVLDKRVRAADTLVAATCPDDTPGGAAAGLDGDTGRHGTHRCVEVVIEGWPEVGALPRMAELKDLLNVQEGFFFDNQDIVDDRRKLEL